MGRARPEPQISVNVSPRQLRRVDFSARQEHLGTSGAEPERLTIELTESAMGDHADAEPILRDLHDLGLQLALDDFGSGYSSLSRLREMPMRRSRSTARSCASARARRGRRDRDRDPRPRARARPHGRRRGSRDRRAARFLVAQGCGLLQGYLLGRPMPRGRGRGRDAGALR